MCGDHGESTAGDQAPGIALDYWKRIDADVGRRIEEHVRRGGADEPAAGMGEA